VQAFEEAEAAFELTRTFAVTVDDADEVGEHAAARLSATIAD
jgi:hypothetical protein